MGIKAQFEALSNINYSSNYNKIFKNNSLELNNLILTIDKVNIHLSNDSKIDYRDENNKFFQDNTLFNNINCRGLGNRNFFSYKTSNMVDFDMLQLSPFLSPNNRDLIFFDQCCKLGACKH